MKFNLRKKNILLSIFALNLLVSSGDHWAFAVVGDSETFPQASSEDKTKKTFKNAARSAIICGQLHQKYAHIFLSDPKVIGPLLKKSGYLALLRDDSLCQNKNLRLSYVAELVKLLDTTANKIAYLTSTNPYNESQVTASTWEGVSLALQEVNLDPKKYAVKVNINVSEKNIEQFLLKVILEEKVSGFIVDVESKLREPVLAFLQEFYTPSVSLSPHPEHISIRKKAVYIFPDEGYLASSLASIAGKRGLKKIAVMRPIDNNSDNFITHFIKAAKRHGITTVGPINYSMENFEDLSAKVKSLVIEKPVQILMSQAELEKDKITNSQIEQISTQESTPTLAVDAILVPDTLLNAVHISKVFKFHGIPKATFMGNHLWRQKMMVASKSHNLKGSFFVDFIGAYTDLPKPLVPTEFGSALILPTDVAAKIDYKLLGYKSAKLFIQAGAMREDRKKSIADNIKFIIANEKKYPSLTLKKSLALWPSHLFEVTAFGIEFLGAR